MNKKRKKRKGKKRQKQGKKRQEEKKKFTKYVSHLLYVVQINDFSLEANIIEQEKLSADWDSNPDPSVSDWVPLPLDHLHSSLLTAL